MNQKPATSGEVESFIAAISDLFWGSKWRDIRGLAQQTWTDFNRSGLPWETVEPHIENGWLNRAHVGDRRYDCNSMPTLEQLDLSYKLKRIQRGDASRQDASQVGELYEGLIDGCEPPGLTDVGRKMLLALQMLEHAANEAFTRITARDQSLPDSD